MKDWLEHLREHAQIAGTELELDSLQPGDLVQIVTLNTVYSFKMTRGREAELTPSRPDRPSGGISIRGCTFGRSFSIKPNSLFCGGNLEFQFDNGRQIQTTSAIQEIRLVRRSE